jgi:uncharacterized membrane protein
MVETEKRIKFYKYFIILGLIGIAIALVLLFDSLL